MNQERRNHTLINSSRRIFLFIGLLIATMSFGQVQTQKGVSYRYNGKNPRTPLPNVTVECVTANNTVISDSTGSFTLTFNKLKMGDRMGLVTVKKREMMVFNQHAVDEWSIRKEPLCLILCNADEFENQKQELIEIGKREAKKKYDRQKADLEQQLEASQIDRARYEAELDTAWQELDRLHKHIDEYADLFARIDESEIDSLAQQALDLFNQGQVDEAVTLFEQGNYLEKLKADNRAIQQANQLIEKIEQGKTNAEKGKEKHIQSLKAQIAAYKIKNEWQKAGFLLKGLADELGDYDALYEYATFCNNQRSYTEAEKYYQKAMALIRQLVKDDPHAYEPDLASTLNDFANLYKDTRQFTKSENMYAEALEIFRHLAKNNSQIYKYYESVTLNNLALLYFETKRFTDSESYYLEALDILHRLYKDSQKDYDYEYAMTMNNIALLYNNIQQLSKSETMYLKALDILKQSVKGSQDEYDYLYAIIMNNIAILYSDTQRLDESEAMFQEALDVVERIVKDNPEPYEPFQATILHNLGKLYCTKQRFKESETMFQKAMDIRMNLALCNPLAYENDLSGTFEAFAGLYEASNQNLDCEAMYLEALNIQERLAQVNPMIYEPNIARIKSEMATFYARTQRPSESEKLYMEALEISRRLAKANPQAYEPGLANMLYNLAYFFFETQRFTESETLFLEVLEIYKRLAKENCQAYKIYEAKTFNSLAALYQATQQFTESKTMYLEALKTIRQLAKDNPQDYNPDLASSLCNYGRQLFNLEEYPKAISIFEEALKLSRTLVADNSDYTKLYDACLYWLGQLYLMTDDHSKNYSINEERLPILRASFKTDNEFWRNEYSLTLGRQSIQCIYMKKYEQAEQYATEALTIEPLQQWIFSNLASALLFQGKYDEAEEIYRNMKTELKDNFLQDLNDFETAKVIPKERKADVERIRKMLTEE